MIEIIYYSFSAIIALILLALFIFGDIIEEAHKERCERWKKEQMEAGMSEEMADFFLLTDNDFMLL